MFKGPQGMSLASNAAAASAVVAAASAAAGDAASAAATSAATAAANKTKMCASSLILPKGLPSDSKTHSVTKNSKYEHLLCYECKFKEIKYYHVECEQAYNTAVCQTTRKNKKSYDQKNRNNRTDQTQQVKISLEPSKNRCDKTKNNKYYEFNTLVSSYSPNSKNDLMMHFINKQSTDHVQYVKQNLEEKLNNINTIEVCGEMIKTYAANNNVKSTDDFYKVCNAASPLLNKAKATKSQVRKSIGSSNYKASDILAGTVQRKVKKRKYTGEDQDRVKVFYERSDISRINPCQKRKKLEKCLHYMKMTFRNAHEIYNKEYPEAMVDFNFFKRSKPGHIRTLAATPLNICSCVYCTNVDEKLKVLGIPGIKTARDLYKELICKKSKSFRNKECIFHTCKECEDWSGKIKSLASSLDMKKKIAYRRWEYIGYEQKHSGKTVPKRTNIPKLKTTEECLEELIKKDILKPQKMKNIPL